MLKNWEEQAAKKLGGKVEPTDIRITVGQELAIVSDIEKGENTNVAGKPGTVSIRATNLFRKESGTWKTIGHHTDLLPYLTEQVSDGPAVLSIRPLMPMRDRYGARGGEREI